MYRIFLRQILDNTEKLAGTIGIGYDFTAANCIGRANCTIGDIILDVTSLADGFEITWTTETTENIFKDCFDLKKGELNWYGGPQRWSQQWPIEKLTINGDEAYVIKKTDNFAVAERYWLNSLGAYIFLEDRVPLFVDQNNVEDGKVCFIADLSGPYINRTRVSFGQLTLNVNLYYNRCVSDNFEIHHNCLR